MATTIEVVQGDIAQQAGIDAVVNAANTDLWMGAGVAGALKRAGGEQIEQEALQYAPIAIGHAITTSAGNLPNRYVIHAAIISYRPEDSTVARAPGSLTSEAIITAAVISALEQAHHHHCRSIAFPLLGTGIGGFPVERCVHVMLNALDSFFRTHPETTIEHVRLVAWSKSDYDVISAAMYQRPTPTPNGPAHATTQ